MSCVSLTDLLLDRKSFIATAMIALFAMLAFASNASAKDVHVNVLVHYGVKGATQGNAGNQSLLYGKNGYNLSHKVAKFVRRKKALRLRLHKRERVVFAGYFYVAAGSSNVHEKRWNGRGVLPLTPTVKINGQKTRIKVEDVFAWVLLKHHLAEKTKLPQVIE